MTIIAGKKMTITEAQLESYRIAKAHMFHEGDSEMLDNPKTKHILILSWLMKIVSEAGEACEGVRKDDYDNVAEELADIVIRCLDTAEALGIDMEAEIVKKMEINRKRPIKHGKNC